MIQPSPQKMMPNAFLFLFSALALLAGCSRPESPVAEGKQPAKVQEHHPPHGGVPVELGEEEYCMEFVLDAPAGKLRAYVLDDEMENFVRIPAASVEVTARLLDREEKLVLMPVANNATGEKVGDTSLFEGKAEWLKTTPVFDAELKEVAVGSGHYSNVLFSFAGGSHEGSSKK